MPRDEALLLEQLLTDSMFRRRFGSDPVGVARESGFPDLADELARGDDRDGRRLDARESRSSAAGVFMAAALEALGLLAVGEVGASYAADSQSASGAAPGQGAQSLEPQEHGRTHDLASANSGDSNRNPVPGREPDGARMPPSGDEARKPEPEEPPKVDAARSGDSRESDRRDQEVTLGTDTRPVDPRDSDRDLPERSARGSDPEPSDEAPRDDDRTPPDHRPPGDPDPGPEAAPPIQSETVLPDQPVDPVGQAAASHLVEYHYGFVRESSSTPDYELLKAAGYNGILFHAEDAHLGEAMAAARAAGIQSVGIWAPANMEDPATFAQRLADLEQYKPDIVVPDVEVEGKGYQGSPQWQWSEDFVSLYRKLVPNQRWAAVTPMGNQDDFDYAAYTSRGASVWPQTYGATDDVKFDPQAMIDVVVRNGVDPRLVNPIVAPGQSAEGLRNFASYLDDFQGTFPQFDR